MVYNAEGQLEKIYHFSLSREPGLSLNKTLLLSYDTDGRLTETRSLYTESTNYEPRDVFHWENGNVVRVNRYNHDSLLQAYFYTYDDKHAVNFDNTFITGLSHVRTRNNVISTDWTDYTGLLDTACKPCLGTYTYHANGLPSSYTTNWGYSLYFVYKALPASGTE